MAVMQQDQPQDPGAEPRGGRAPRRSRRRQRTAQDTRAWRRRMATYALLAFSFILMVNALVGENGYLATVRAEREYDTVASELAALRAENERLAEEIRRLRTDPAALEEAARGTLNMIKPGEKMIIIRDAKPAGR
jgi:cell division protein FtsB